MPSVPPQSWYRDYAAYCGVSDDSRKVDAVVTQISRRKPILKKPYPPPASVKTPLPVLPAPFPTWQRTPMRVSFENGQQKQTFAIRGHTPNLANDVEDREEEASK
jgi:hypothetical protein